MSKHGPTKKRFKLKMIERGTWTLLYSDGNLMDRVCVSEDKRKGERERYGRQLMMKSCFETGERDTSYYWNVTVPGLDGSPINGMINR